MKRKMTLTQQNESVVTIQQEDVNRAWCENIVKNASIMSGEMRFSNIPIHLLNKPRYQRDYDIHRVNSIAAHWSDNKCSSILVSYRDGKFWFVDGQHRIEAGKIVGKVDMLCQILTGYTEEKEFELYRDQGVNVRPVSVYENVVGGAAIGRNPEADIIRVLESRGIIYARRGKREGGVLTAMSKVNEIYNLGGERALEWVLDTIHDMGWAGLPKCYSSSVLHSINSFRKVHLQSYVVSLEYARDAVVVFCKKYTPDEFISWAKIHYPKASGDITAMNLALKDIVRKSCLADKISA